MTTFAPATLADIPALMRIERREGFEILVGRWSAEQHAAEMAVRTSHYITARSADGDVEGFVLFQNLDDPHGCALLRRIAVAQPGAGLGTLLLDSALAYAFEHAQAHRVQLQVYPENVRARRAYARAGFSEEGLLRDYRRRPDGTRVSMLMLSLLRPEWRERRESAIRTAPSGRAPDR